MNKINIIKENGKIIDWSFVDDVDCDYYEFGEELIRACVLEGADIGDLFDLNLDDIPLICEIDFLESEISNDIFVGYGFYRKHNNFKVKFFVDDVLDKGTISGINPYEYLSTLEKIAYARDGFDVIVELDFDTTAFSMILSCDGKLGNNIKDSFFDCFRKMDNLLNQVEAELQSFYSLIRSDRFEVKIPKEIRTSIRQYLLFFEDFVRESKGKDLSINVSKTEIGVEVQIIPNEQISMLDINDWFTEYINLSRQNTDSLKVNFGSNISETQADLLIADLKNEISHLKNSIEIGKLKNRFLKNENEFLRQLTLSLSKAIPEKVDSKDNRNKVELKELVGKAEYQTVIKNLKKIFQEIGINDSEIFLVESRLSRLRKSKIEGSLSVEFDHIETNKIVKSLLELLDKI